MFKDELVCPWTDTWCPPNSTLTGLIGGYLPVLHYAFARRAGGFITMDIAPDPSSPAGYAQAVLFRFLRLAANGTVLASQCRSSICALILTVLL